MNVTRPRCPWPGARPYAEQEAPFFFGRTDEVDAVADRLRRSDLVILNAGSGSGKTSFIRAGLIPHLRNCRADEREQPRIGLVLCLREWGSLGETSPANMILAAAKREIDALPGLAEKYEGSLSSDYKELMDQIADSIRSDAEKLGSVARVATPGGRAGSAKRAQSAGGPDALVEFLRAVCNKVGSLILVLDQTEELLGSGRRRSGVEQQIAVCDTIARIHEYCDHVQLLLSLRSEYVECLRHLEDRIRGGLDSRDRRYSLNPMEKPTAIRMILDSAKRGGVDLQESVAGKLIALAQRHNNALSASSGVTEQPSDEATVARVDTAEDLDLLNLQAAMRELFGRAAGRSSGKGGITIGLSLVRQYAKELDEREETPLSQYLREKLSIRAGNQLWGLLEARMCARMLPRLSSAGGFKYCLPKVDLVLAGAEEDLRKVVSEDLGGAGESLRSVVARILDGKGDGGFKQSLRDVRPEKDRKDDPRSGVARFERWKPADVANELVRAAARAVESLSSKEIEILKVYSGGSRAEQACELVHDGFGDVLNSWAKRFRSSLDFVLASITRNEGENLVGPRLPIGPKDTESFAAEWRRRTRKAECVRVPDKGELRSLEWRGRVLKSVAFEGITFRQCDLAGSTFINVGLTDCVFEDCVLKGASVLGGTWRNIKIRRTKSDAGSDGGLRGMFIAGLTIDGSRNVIADCVLDSSTWKNVMVNGTLRFRGCSLQFMKFLDLPTWPNVQIGTDCSVSHSFFGARSEEAIRLRTHLKKCQHGDDCLVASKPPSISRK